MRVVQERSRVGAIAGWALVSVVRALSGIFGVALYRYAADGDAAGGFTPDELQSAVRPR
jgi:hypothetical protein